jgi:glycosyl transferase family 25
MLALCLNLDEAEERWKFTRQNFANQGIELQRVSAVKGKDLQFPIPEHDSKAYRRFHGKKTIPAEVGCYLSHIKAMKLFLDSEESHALICEDDVKPADHLEEILASAMNFGEHWDILRLSGFRNAKPQSIGSLKHGYSLCINLSYLAGTGAYILNRQAASVLSERLLPMFLPYDHALDREWLWGLKSLCVHPLPVDQGNHEFATQIVTRNSKAAWYERYWTVFPFRVKTQTMRFIRRSQHFVRHRMQTAG